MGRQIRHVPANWKHPKETNRYNGERQYKPLMDDYVGSLKYYKESVDDFIKYMTTVIQKGKVKIYDTWYKTPKEVYEYLAEDGQMNPPDINNYMPNGDWYQLFEDVSEGTPLSPPFKTKKELVDWMTNNDDFWGHRWTKEQAEGMVKSEFVMSGLMSAGKMYTPEEQAELFNKEK